MAYAALLSLTHVLQRTLKYDCSYLLPGEEQQIQSLLKKVVYLQDFLDNFPPENMESIERLERKIGDAACQTEDIIEYCIAHRVLEESASHSGDITTSFHEIAKLIEEVDSIKTKAEKIEDESGIQEDLECNTSLPVGSSRPDSWSQNTMVGLDDALKEIKDRLVGDSLELDVVSVVGMGGIGKTTLAHKVYIDNYIKHRFDICAWITISQEYSVREIILGLLESMKIRIEERSEKDIDQLGELLYKNLKGMRYLLVLDDVWDIEAWDRVERYFPKDRTGSRILLTTRLEKVANNISSSSPLHHVRFLNDEECWNLFCQKVFGEGCCPLELEKIGKKIAQNCRGLPLTVVVIGRLLSKATKTPHYWRSIAENLSSERKGSNGKIKTCRIHDLLRDLCVREAEKENFFEVQKRSLRDIYRGIKDGKRRVSIHVKKNSLSFSDRVRFYHATQRTLQIDFVKFNYQRSKRSSSIEVHLDSRPLKVLHMDGIHTRLRMKASDYLQYIYCYNKFSQNFTSSIYELRNLQTIVCLDDYGYIELPPEIWKMTQLRHVKVNGEFVYLPNPPSSKIKGEENSVVLENLQTLSKIFNFRLTEDILERIPNLLKLAIHYDSIEEASWEKYCINNLVRLTKLESLKCWLTYTFPCFLSHITFPTSLKKLTLEGAELQPKDYLKLYPEELTILGKVPNLEVLKLKNYAFDGLEWEPNEEEFVKLKFLLLDDIYLMHWRADSSHFPKLERLVISIKACRELDEIPSGFGESLTLQSIELRGCGDSIVRSAKNIEEAQFDCGNDAFKLYIKK